MATSGSGSATGTTPPPAGGGAYVSPDVEFIKHVTKLTEKIEGITAGELDADLAQFIPQGEVATAYAVGVDLFDSPDLTSREVYGMQVSVAYRVGAYYLRGAASQPVTGTGAPRKTELSVAYSDLADTWDNDDPPGEAQRWDDRVRGVAGGGEGPPPGSEGAGAGGVRPQMVTAGVVPSLETISPSERLRLLDERSDQPGGRDW
jgi:hypothetical protein